MSSEQLANRILAAEARIRSHELLAGKITEEQMRSFIEVARDLERMPLYIDDTPALPISALAARARRLKRQHGLDVMVVDYLQLVRPASSRDQGRVNEVSEISQGLKAIAKELDIPVIALSQLSRKVEDREDKRPQLADLRESGSIEQDADVVMFVYRESYYHDRPKPSEDEQRFPEWQARAEKLHGRAEVIIGKQRHGPIGTVDLHFQDSFTKFSDPVRETNGYMPAGSGTPARLRRPGVLVRDGRVADGPRPGALSLRARLTVDLGAIVANWRALDALTAPGCETAAVVKADGYGCGAPRGRAGAGARRRAAPSSSPWRWKASGCAPPSAPTRPSTCSAAMRARRRRAMSRTTFARC